MNELVERAFVCSVGIDVKLRGFNTCESVDRIKGTIYLIFIKLIFLFKNYDENCALTKFVILK